MAVRLWTSRVWAVEKSRLSNMCGSQDDDAMGCDDSFDKTTAEMQTAITFLIWGTCGNEGIWTIDEGRDYPKLWWQNRPGEPISKACMQDGK